MARRDGGGGGGGGVPRLLLWLALWGLWRGGDAGALPARGEARPFGAGPPAACSPRCQHGGLCLGNGTCLCSKGYEGELCQHGNGPASRRGRGARTCRRAGRGRRAAGRPPGGEPLWGGRGRTAGGERPLRPSRRRRGKVRSAAGRAAAGPGPERPAAGRPASPRRASPARGCRALFVGGGPWGRVSAGTGLGTVTCVRSLTCQPPCK